MLFAHVVFVSCITLTFPGFLSSILTFLPYPLQVLLESFFLTIFSFSLSTIEITEHFFETRAPCSFLLGDTSL